MSDVAPRRRHRTWIGWTVALLVVILVACTAWIGIRGIGAVGALASVERGAAQLRTQLAIGEVAEARGIARRIAAETTNARTLTNDPIWRTLEATPWLGGDLKALRVIAQASDKIARDTLPALLEAAQTTDLSTLGIQPGYIDATSFEMAGAKLLSAAKSAGVAKRLLAGIDPTGLITPLRDTVEPLAGTIADAARSTGALADAAALLSVLTAGDHTYLIVIEDATGIRFDQTVPVGFLPVRVQNGVISLGAVAGPGAIDTAGGLNTDDFGEGGLTVATAWAAANKVRVSGLIALDLDAVASLVSATGPVTVDGVELTPKGAADMLREGIDAERPDGAAAFRVLAAGAILSRVADGTAEPHSVIGALASATDGGHVRTWFGDPAVQERLASSSLAG